jgi:hypothetical protein
LRTVSSLSLCYRPARMQPAHSAPVSGGRVVACRRA